ncbi:heme-binding domain-containing protein [Marixanthomonas sp. SCSIO 43207]|uniref:heme-binding domain-containing protein n=1 Tax=Marixanthomonas sp. SCSIO 43207 TaxID=2779360 RepID=UPI001CA9E097|nr:heme-binding domain-containing protein [Marixanthomonas sp. SCSIO 43207]UAB81010.1 heme-binding domain-containing protein [Marixanthomonas sp. SCSIO 43207]
MKIVKYILQGLLVILIILQFIRPEKNTNGYESISEFETETKPSSDVSLILKENCYNCHSNHTEYPWYAEIAPISFFINEHINHGKSHFNVSEWNTYSAKKKDRKIEELVEMVEKEEMPLNSYKLLHGDMSENEQKLLLQWAGLVRLQYKSQLKVSIAY